MTRRGHRAVAVHAVETADLAAEEMVLMRQLIGRALINHTGPGMLGFERLVGELTDKLKLDRATVRAMVLTALPPRPVRVTLDGAEWSLLRLSFDGVSIVPSRRRSGRRLQPWPDGIAALARQKAQERPERMRCPA